MSRIRDAIMEATGYSVRGEQAEAAARAVGELIRDLAPECAGDKMRMDVIFHAIAGAEEDPEPYRATVANVRHAVEAVQALADEALGESDS